MDDLSILLLLLLSQGGFFFPELVILVEYSGGLGFIMRLRISHMLSTTTMGMLQCNVQADLSGGTVAMIALCLCVRTSYSGAQLVAFLWPELEPRHLQVAFMIGRHSLNFPGAKFWIWGSCWRCDMPRGHSECLSSLGSWWEMRSHRITPVKQSGNAARYSSQSPSPFRAPLWLRLDPHCGSNGSISPERTPRPSRSASETGIGCA